MKCRKVEKLVTSLELQEIVYKASTCHDLLKHKGFVIHLFASHIYLLMQNLLLVPFHPGLSYVQSCTFVVIMGVRNPTARKGNPLHTSVSITLPFTLWQSTCGNKLLACLYCVNLLETPTTPVWKDTLSNPGPRTTWIVWLISFYLLIPCPQFPSVTGLPCH